MASSAALENKQYSETVTGCYEGSKRIETVALKTGYIKVKLYYHTPVAKHFRSMVLQSFGANPPYIEDVCILLPRMKTFDMMECFLAPFERLQVSGIVHPDAQLLAYEIADEDRYTLAYLV